MKIFNLNIKDSIFACIAIGMIAIGCEKKLDVQPYQSMPVERALLTESDVSGTLVGAYDAASSAAAYGGDMMVLNDLIGNKTNINFRGTFAGLVEAWNTSMIANNSFAASTWSAAYNTINVSNNVLENLDKIVSSTTKKQSAEGQALFLRASMYFELLKLYSRPYNDGNPAINLGVPIVLTSTKVPTMPKNAAAASAGKPHADGAFPFATPAQKAGNGQYPCAAWRRWRVTTQTALRKREKCLAMATGRMCSIGV